MGLVWIGIGFPMKNYPLSAMGLVFAIAGIMNKDKWKENHKCTPSIDKKMKISLVVGLTVLLVAGLVFFLMAR